MDWIDRLIDDGIYAITGSPGPAGHPALGQGQAWLLPQRQPGARALPGSGTVIPQDPRGAGVRWTPPDPDVLRRLLGRAQEAGVMRLQVADPAPLTFRVVSADVVVTLNSRAGPWQRKRTRA
jgi:hypothetical protein